MRILVLDAFYGGSHRVLTDFIVSSVIPESAHCHLETMTAKKWHWRARTAALHFASAIPEGQDFDVIFSTSVLNITELVALRADLAKAKKARMVQF